MAISASVDGMDARAESPTTAGADASIRLFDAAAVAAALDDRRLIEALRSAFAAGGGAPARQIVRLGDEGALLAVMPVWRDRFGAVKLATLTPGNPSRGLPTIQALVVLFDARTGTPLAVADGAEITRRRTAAASALAADYLALPDAERLAMIGAGALAPHMIRAHCAVRPIAAVDIWARDPQRAAAVASAVARALPEVEINAVAHPESAVGGADLVCCATSASSPVLRGAWLRAGAHVDLVGSFSPDAREADDEVVRGARIFVDTREGALAEAGDLIQPLARGAIVPPDIAGELSDLCAGRAIGREGEGQVTVFKSVGAALEDLVAAQLLLETSR
ncbi:MAG TPA: ornithine cyclodeaminase family protein [Caulobacteraceae bacterium]|nr:ornithine cyclodeaminase family protein [Caulobacteraceae bacterium]